MITCRWTVVIMLIQSKLFSCKKRMRYTKARYAKMFYAHQLQAQNKEIQKTNTKYWDQKKN